MKYAYNYEIILVDESAKCMEIVYTAPNRDPVHVSARLPYQGEDLLTLIQSYSPVPRWIEEEAVYIAPVIGTSGSYTPPVRVETLDSAKEEKKAAIAFWRYQREIAGVTVGSSLFPTDRRSQARVASAYTSLKDGLLASVDWKTESGQFVTLGLAEVTAVASAVAQHVQDCFTIEKQLYLNVEACTSIEEVNTLNLDSVIFHNITESIKRNDSIK